MKNVEKEGPLVFCSYKKLISPKKLAENPQNPNKHPKEQLDLLISVIKNRGWRVPITVSNLSGYVVRGHGRLQAALIAGWKKVPVDYQDYVSPSEELADLLADNKLSELSFLDDKLLESNLKWLEKEDFDISNIGFNSSDLEESFFDDDFELPDGEITEKDPMVKFTIFVEASLKKEIFTQIKELLKPYENQTRIL